MAQLLRLHRRPPSSLPPSPTLRAGEGGHSCRALHESGAAAGGPLHAASVMGGGLFQWGLGERGVGPGRRRNALSGHPTSSEVVVGATLNLPLPLQRRGGPIRLRPQIRRDDPLNLSILLSGGK